MLKFIPPNAVRILEVGCGKGMFGKCEKKFQKLRVLSIEPFPEAAESAEHNIDRVIHSNFDDCYDELPKNYFNCVIFNDVLEHFVKPFVTLEKLYNILPAGASIASSLPNVRYVKNMFNLLVKKDWKYLHSGGILDSTHLLFFMRRIIFRMLKKNRIYR